MPAHVKPPKPPTGDGFAGANTTAPDAQTFETMVETSLRAFLADPEIKGELRLKAIAQAIKWAAVKARLVLPEHGSGFMDEEE